MRVQSLGRTGCTRVAIVWVAIFWAGCICIGCIWGGGALAQTQIELRLDTGASWHHQTAANCAVQQFLGSVCQAGGAQDGSGGGGGSGGGRILALGRDVPVRSTAQWGLSFGVFHSQHMAPRLSIRAGLRLSVGQAEYVLKQGADRFVDPITVSIDHVAVTPELAFRGRLVQRGRWHITAEAGSGLDLLRARTRLSSALLDVRRQQDFRDFHLFGGIEVGYGRTATSLRLRHSDRNGAQLSLGQVLRF